ncbi:MAG: response regulator transcription factor [Candidatus Methylophosphatis roskildensis]
MKTKTVVPKAAVRVLLADDHPLLLAGFAAVLADYNIDVVGKAASASEAVEKFKRLRPDVLVLDIRFGDDISGLQAAAAVLSDDPDAKVMFLSQFDDVALIREGYRVGARAYVIKNRDPQELATAIVMVNDGELFFQPDIAQQLANIAIRGESSPSALLDKRQLEIFVQMARGKTNAEIADSLGLSPKTISNESQAIKVALGMDRPADLTRLAIKHGLLQP